jgi:hypothetical protein
MLMVDPVDLDPTKIRVPDWQRTVCDFHQEYPTLQCFGCGCSSSIGTKVVPAKMVEETCGCCGGSGKVQKKVPASSTE